MRQKSETRATKSEQIVKSIRRMSRKHHSAEEKIWIVLDGLSGQYGIAEHCLSHPGMFSACRRHTTGIFDAGLQQRAPQTLRSRPASTRSAIKLSQVAQLE